MSEVPEANRFAPPVAHVEDVTAPGTALLAGRGTRLLAAIVDGLIAGVLFLVIAFATPFNVYKPDMTGGFFTIMVENTLMGFVIFLILHGYLLHTRGQTIAKLLFKIRIVRSDGSRASLLRLAGLRYFVNSVLALIPVVGWIYAMVDVLLIFRDSRKCLHDNLADTIVVQA